MEALVSSSTEAEWRLETWQSLQRS